MFDAPPHLRGTRPRVGAAEVDIALFGCGERETTIRTLRRHHKNPLQARSFFDYWSKNFGDNITRFSQHDRVADEDAFGFHYVLVVQCGPLHFAPSNSHRLQHRVGRRASRATHTDDDVEKPGGYLLWRILIRDRPPRSARGSAHLALKEKLVHLDHSPIDFVGNLVTIFVVRMDEIQRPRATLTPS